MIKIKWFKKIFNSEENKQYENVELLDNSLIRFNKFGGNAYSNDIFRGAIDSIARNIGKLKPRHIIRYDGVVKDGNINLNYILNTRPNPFIDSYSFLYKLVTHYYLYNNAFAFIERDFNGSLKAIYNISPLNMEYLSDKNNNLYCKFIFNNGQSYTLPFGDVIILRRHFNKDDLLGDTNNAINPTLEVAHMQNQGMEKSIENGAKIRGILKLTQVLAPEKIKSEKERFIKDYLSPENNGGIISLDSKMEYQPLEDKPINVDTLQVEHIKTRIYEYLGISEKIVNSTYNESEWSAFYESVIEPFSLQLALELTHKLFTKREISFGNQVILEANRLQFASNKSKTEMLKEIMPLGILSINQALEILNLPPINDGDKRLQTLNVIDTDIANKYQLGKIKGGGKIE